jgi:hypothetical protein
MLFPAPGTVDRCREQLSRLASGANPREVADALHAIDPEYMPAYLLDGDGLLEEGNLDAAEAAYWKAIEVSPGQAEGYLGAGGARQRRDKNDGLAMRLTALGVRRAIMAHQGLEALRDMFGPVLERQDLDTAEYDSYECVAEALEHSAEGLEDAAESKARLRPYLRLYEVETWPPDEEWLGEVLADGQACVPVFHRALRAWARGAGEILDDAIAYVVAILGESAGMEVFPDLYEVSVQRDREIFLHGSWAVWRMGQRFPEAVREWYRATIPELPPTRRCAVAEQLVLAAPREGDRELLLGLLDDFESWRSHGDAGYLLMAVSDALLQRGLSSDAEKVLEGRVARLTADGRAWILSQMQPDTDFVPQLVMAEIAGLSIRDVCVDGRLFDDDVSDELDEDEFEDDFLPPAPVVRPPRPGRNEPCWCGSGKKYKKCHLEADESGDGGETPVPPGENLGEPLYVKVFTDVTEATQEWFGRSNFERAIKVYFGKEASKSAPDPEEGHAFLEWYIRDFRREPGGPTAVEEYLRRRGDRLPARERAMLDSWRDARFGLYEVQRVEPERGVEVKDLYEGDVSFVQDVTTSRSANRWDVMLTRVEEFEGKRLFGGTGTLVPRGVLPELFDFIEKGRAVAGQNAAVFVRANSHRLHRLVREMQAHQMAGLELRNSDGEALEMGNAVWQVRDTGSLTAALKRLRDVEATGAGKYVWLAKGKGDGRTVRGNLDLQGGRLKLECNSRARLAEGRKLIEGAARSSVRHIGDTFTPAEDLLRKARSAPPTPAPPPIPIDVQRELLGQAMDRHWAEWPDHPLPALAGRTPKAAIETAEGRARVLDLIHDFENATGRQNRAGHLGYDFSRLRAALGIGPDE